MKKLAKISLGIALAFISTITFAQEEENELSNVQKFTPSKLLSKGQWDIKFFNSFYSQNKSANGNGDSVDEQRSNFFTSTNEVYFGVSENSRLNIGLIVQARANTSGGDSRFSVLKFEDNRSGSRSGLTVIAPSVRFQPFANVGNFSITSTFHIPVFKDTPSFFLDQRSFAWENKFFYDKTFGGGKWQVFTEVDIKYNFGESQSEADADENSTERFANDSFSTPISAFLSYFPSSKSTIFINAQQLILTPIGDNDFSQEGTILGFGGKYQLTPTVNIEASYGNIVRGTDQGLGSTLSIGLRILL